jgi:hypothetical protein
MEGIRMDTKKVFLYDAVVLNNESGLTDHQENKGDLIEKFKFSQGYNNPRQVRTVT